MAKHVISRPWKTYRLLRTKAEWRGEGDVDNTDMLGEAAEARESSRQGPSRRLMIWPLDGKY